MLLANNDRRTNNTIQAVVLDVCYNQAAVNCVQTARLDELLKHGGRGGYQLVLVNPDNLIYEPGRKNLRVRAEETALVVREIKQRHAVPVVAFAVRAEDEWCLSNAGADSVLVLPFDAALLGSEVRRLLRMRNSAPEPEPPRTSLAGWFTSVLRLKPSSQSHVGAE